MVGSHGLPWKALSSHERAFRFADVSSLHNTELDWYVLRNRFDEGEYFMTDRDDGGLEQEFSTNVLRL
jgi:hypothetical protein